jgi:hypothetical protein
MMKPITELAGATVKRVERYKPDTLALHTDRGTFYITYVAAWSWSDPEEGDLDAGLHIKHVQKEDW